MSAPADEYALYFGDLASVTPPLVGIVAALALIGLCVRFVLFVGRQV